jgi:hypothetical protein
MPAQPRNTDAQKFGHLGARPLPMLAKVLGQQAAVHR